MELYVEKAFLDKFNSEFAETPVTKGKTVLTSILKTYGDVNLYIDYVFETPKELELYNINLITLKSQDFPVIPIISIKEHFFAHSKCEQTLIFTINEETWFKEAEKKGALCFCYENYEKTIESIISICENLKVDLSESFRSWDYFKELKTIPKNKIIINDGYLFAENSGNKPIEENIIPLLKNVIKPDTETKIEFFTNYLNFKRESERFDIEKIKRKLLNVFQGDYKLSFEYIQYHSHDRILYSNFFLMGCGVGFNFNTKRKSNSVITVDSIFDKFSYKRINNHLIELKKRI
ncbi:hypothetical protein SAMN05444395_11142 [Flavobacterium fryxellicola]|uniref:Uncharacterized protein n=1 Tax=Flavobacterium fryxellicola TaxID=249352 RepID=A0A167ZL15_9FLAO|nr:hypothetical protein [Flavobacterium fryxellicola]OAB30563.1 hypothetical protein FBFR_01835 [Flavobacterium fryxellicola]SHN77029.1 hypothetical protein SAMN05444395_11142 [Flavobacterium fryxellicola]